MRHERWAKQVYWMFGVVLDESTGLNAFQLAKQLKEKGVDTRPFFLGMHVQPVLQKMKLFNDEKYPVAERIARQGLYLPSGLTLTEKQLNEVCKAIKTILKN